MKSIILTLFFSVSIQIAFGQINAKLMRYADVSDVQITFVYGGDIWLVPKEGGVATQLTHSPGEESYPRFSPDGKHIAFTASYQGNQDVYMVPVTGGLPQRLTYASWPDRMVAWQPNGNHLIFASRREIGQRSSRQFFEVSKSGGYPKKHPIPYGELASFSPDGRYIAYTTKITENYPFKRYRGGLSSDIYIYDNQTGKTTNITDNHAIDSKPAWGEKYLYFLSDRDENMRLNIWSYDTTTEDLIQRTHFEDFDISNLSYGSGTLVFEAGGTLYTMNTSDHSYSPVSIQVISDLSAEMPRKQDVSRSIRSVTAAPGGNRLVFEARGELFETPMKEGYTLNLTRSSGAFDRDPSWSPDGNHLAFWSDKNGEFDLYLRSYGKQAETRQLTSHGKGYGYTLYWSPDSKKMAYVDYQNDILILDVETGNETIADNLDWNLSHPGRQGYPISWSMDSKWITYSKGVDNAHNAIFIYHVDKQEVSQVTNGFYDDQMPVFSADGKYLFYATDRNLRPHYSDMDDGTWVYPNATHIAALPLTKDAPHLLAPKNDSVELKDEKKKDEEKDKEVDAKEKGEKEEESVSKDTAETSLKIDLENIESRLFLLPSKPGNIGGLHAVEGKLVYMRLPNTGSDSNDGGVLMLYDLAEREEKSIMEGVNSAKPTADGKKLVVRSRGQYGIVGIQPGQKIKDAVPIDGLVMDLVPREEWQQLFDDAWRRHRDFFYDPDMHGLDWQALRDQYGTLIEDARTRWDVSFIISNLSAELSAGHTYTFGGDVENAEPQNTGYLGINWELADDKYRIGNIVRPADWDHEVRSPFDMAGVDVDVGDYIHSVNGIPLDPSKDPYASFEGLSEKTVSLYISKSGVKEEAKEYIVKCLSLSDESRLRHLAWIESNRRQVDELSEGKLGYVYMSNTAGRGQLELVRMYYGQLHKEGFIIDERFNGGGQLADRFLELMTKPVVYNLHWRHGRDHTWPVKTNTGPKGMLINGWAGSGGDGLPWAFQELQAGPIVGERTLGILVGPATGHRLIDGGGITVPGARLYDNDGHWFWEGVGVTPDIEVWDDPNILMQGRDPQIERVVEEVMKLIETNPKMATPAPPAEKRTAKALENDR